MYPSVRIGVGAPSVVFFSLAHRTARSGPEKAPGLQLGSRRLAIGGRPCDRQVSRNALGQDLLELGSSRSHTVNGSHAGRPLGQLACPPGTTQAVPIGRKLFDRMATASWELQGSVTPRWLGDTAAVLKPSGRPALRIVRLRMTPLRCSDEEEGTWLWVCAEAIDLGSPC